jgi:hypothetical protein
MEKRRGRVQHPSITTSPFILQHEYFQQNTSTCQSESSSGPFLYLQQLYLLHAVEPGLAVHHLEYLDLLEGDDHAVVEGLGAVHHAELTLPDLPVDLEACGQ